MLIYLTMGHETEISEIDADLSKLSWRYLSHHTGNGYAVMKNDRKIVRLSRIILERILGRALQPFEFADHINKNTLDNRRENLRVATNQQNKMNGSKHSDGSNIYKGVYWYKRKNKFQASICLNGKNKHLGYFDNAKDAALVYDKMARLYFGEFANTNFTEELS